MSLNYNLFIQPEPTDTSYISNSGNTVGVITYDINENITRPLKQQEVPLIKDVDDIVKIKNEPQRTNYFIYSSDPNSQIIDLDGGEYIIWIPDGEIDITIDGNMTTLSGNDSYSFTLLTPSNISVNIVTTPSFVQLENGPYKTSYIETTDYPVTREEQKVYIPIDQTDTMTFYTKFKLGDIESEKKYFLFGSEYVDYNQFNFRVLYDSEGFELVKFNNGNTQITGKTLEQINSIVVSDKISVSLHKDDIVKCGLKIDLVNGKIKLFIKINNDIVLNSSELNFDLIQIPMTEISFNDVLYEYDVNNYNEYTFNTSTYIPDSDIINILNDDSSLQDIISQSSSFLGTPKFQILTVDVPSVSTVEVISDVIVGSRTLYIPFWQIRLLNSALGNVYILKNDNTMYQAIQFNVFTGDITTSISSDGFIEDGIPGQGIKVQNFTSSDLKFSLFYYIG